MKKQLPLLLGILVYFFFVRQTYAVSITLSQIPTTITGDTFTLSASISGAAAGTNYLRIDLYKDGTQNYFGETYNGSDWYGGSDFTQYLPVGILSGKSWIGQIQGHVGNPSQTQYDGSGTYRLRLRRYTASGNNTASEADGTSVIVAIAVPTITPTPMPTDTPIPQPSPTASPSPRVSTPTTAKIPTATVIPQRISPTERADGASQEAILADQTNILTPVPTTVVLDAKARVNVLPVVFFSLAGILFVGCGILLFRQYKFPNENE